MKLMSLVPWTFGILCLSQQVQAKAAYGMAGCGLGSVIIGSEGGQISAATTNGTSYSQPFGITSGTSNCKTSEEMAVIMKQHEFLSANLSTLQKEMAQGQGQTLDAFIEVLGCSDEVQGAASESLVKGYSAIFSAPGIEQVLDVAKQQLIKDQNLAQQCSSLS